MKIQRIFPMPAKTPRQAGQGPEIAGRLIQLRCERGSSQKVLAIEMGLSRDQLASIESGRVPLRFWPAVRACEFLKASLRWLATGSGPREQRFVIRIESSASEITERTSLEAGFQIIAERYSEMEMLFDPFPFEAREHGIKRARPPLLDNRPDPALNIVHMPANEISLWGELRVRLLVATFNLGRGSRSFLAREMGVSRQAVSEWLSGSSTPGAEITLRLRKWVKAAEVQHQQKDRDGATNTAAASDPKKPNQTNEKAKSNRPKG